jgi:hypothetical protein
MDVSARKIADELQRLGVNVRDFYESLAATWRNPLPAGITLFGDSARLAVVDNDLADGGAMASTLYTELAGRTQEVDSTKTIIDRVEQRFQLKPRRPVGGTAYGTASMHWPSVVIVAAQRLADVVVDEAVIGYIPGMKDLVRAVVVTLAEQVDFSMVSVTVCQVW